MSELFSLANGAVSPLAATIPALVFAAVAELAVSLVRKDGHHEVKDSAFNAVMSVGNMLANKVWSPLGAGAFAILYTVTPFRVPETAWWAWVLLFVLDDFCYYVSHLCAHRIPVLWASHIVHHSTKQMNLSVAMRNSWTGAATDWMFWIPVALLGFSPRMIITMQALSLVWSFLVHTRYVGKLGRLEGFLNTPSHHRAHHGTNPQYVNKNFGGVLILWDRMFGTFVREEEAPVYGTSPMPKQPLNPFYVAFYGWWDLARGAMRSVSSAGSSASR